jgi:hypothetical protein
MGYNETIDRRPTTTDGRQKRRSAVSGQPSNDYKRSHFWEVFIMKERYQTTNVLAMISFAAGIAAWTILPFIGTVAAIITGHLAKGEIRRTYQAGEGLATLGLVMGYAHLILTILGILVGLLVLVLFLMGFSVLAFI